MKTLIQLFIALSLALTLALSGTKAAAWSEIIQIEDSVEVEPKSTTYFLGKNLNGSILTKKCRQCPTEKFSISPETLAFNDKVKVKLSSKYGLTKKPNVMIYNIETNKITRLIWNKKIVR